MTMVSIAHIDCRVESVHERTVIAPFSVEQLTLHGRQKART